MIEIEKRINRPKADAGEIARIIEAYGKLDTSDNAYKQALGELAEDAAAQLEAHLHHGTQHNADSRFDELQAITQAWEKLLGNRTLDQEK